MSDYIRYTKQLIKALTTLESIYRNDLPVERSREFFNKIKPEAEQYLVLLSDWEKQARLLTQKGVLKIFPQQIDATVDNMKALIMHSYYKDVRKRRYIEIKKSCYYIFTESMEELSD